MQYTKGLAEVMHGGARGVPTCILCCFNVAMHARPTMHARGRGFCKMRGLAAGLGVMLVDEGGADGEAGGDSACNSIELQLVGVLGRDRCSGVAAAAGRDRTTGGARGRLRRVGLLRLDSGQPMVGEVGVGLSRH